MTLSSIINSLFCADYAILDISSPTYIGLRVSAYAQQAASKEPHRHFPVHFFEVRLGAVQMFWGLSLLCMSWWAWCCDLNCMLTMIRLGRAYYCLARPLWVQRRSDLGCPGSLMTGVLPLEWFPWVFEPCSDSMLYRKNGHMVWDHDILAREGRITYVCLDTELLCWPKHSFWLYLMPRKA